MGTKDAINKSLNIKYQHDPRTQLSMNSGRNVSNLSDVSSSKILYPPDNLSSSRNGNNQLINDSQLVNESQLNDDTSFLLKANNYGNSSHMRINKKESLINNNIAGDEKNLSNGTDTKLDIKKKLPHSLQRLIK